MADIDPANHPHIYRAIRSSRWYDSGARRVLSVAFIRRQGEEGLSVLKDVQGCSREVCLAPLETCFGEFVLDTDRVLALNFSVSEDEPDDPTYNENHSEIQGIPPRDDVLEAEHAATSLAAIARLHFDRKGRF